MNIMSGILQGDTFADDGPNIKVPAKQKVVKAMLDFRPEDCAVTAAGKGEIAGQIFTNELIGDHTLVTIKTKKDMLAVKAAKEYQGKSGDAVGVSLHLDCASHLSILLKFFPLTIHAGFFPGMLVFLLCWNECLFAVNLTSD